MNERIKKLAEQAKDYAWEMNPEEDSYGRAAYPKKFQQDRDSKFAELIVRECVSVAMEQYNDTLPWGGVEDVLKHFGVEE